MKFSELGLDPKLLSAIEDAGYETPTPIQEQAIPHALQGRDVLGIAQTGTGKTASFTLPMIHHLSKGRARARMPRSLILAPTRELAAQVSANFDTYGKNHSLTMALLIGGVSFKDQDKLIDRGVDVLIATPGRLLDHFERGKLMLTGIEIMVVDEADRMLDMGFIEDIERIFKLTPFTRQTLFFSATMPPEITRLTQEFLSNPARVEVARQATAAETVAQHLCQVKVSRRDRADAEKRATLRALIDAQGEKLTNGIIFCNRKRDVGILYKSLTSHGYDVAALHGDLDQRIRTQVLDSFRNSEIKLLVASDVAARGLDIPIVSHVFNYDVPIHAEDYVHRIGRTGRAGRDGMALTLATRSDDKFVAKIEEMLGNTIPRLDSPIAEQSRDAEPEADQETERAPRRRRRRRGETDDAREETSGETAKAETADAQSKADDAKPEQRRERKPRSDRPEREETRGGDRKRDRNRGGRGKGRGGDRSSPVVGMGDHVPAFLLREVPAPSRKKTADSEDDAESEVDEKTEESLDAA